ncbi:MAG: glycosyltransferase [Lachnospiraceae bacterium]|nr:glycosyltransferase [Lachnospiraceae bacterium]
MDSKYLITIITVCLNAEKDIKKTIESVLNQDFDNFEYIIKDAASTDSTLDIINDYRPLFEKKGISFTVYSEPDKGIYDGMNFAVKHSLGRWINFMNAGDCFYSASTLSDIFSQNKYPNAAIIYGDSIEFEYGHYYKFRKNIEEIENRMPFSHQSCFVNRELIARFPFNTKLKIGADYDFLLSAYEKGFHFQDTGKTVCIVSKDGVSSLSIYDTFMETMEIKKSHGVRTPSEGSMKRAIADKRIKQFVTDHFPDFIKKKIRQLQWKIRKQNVKVVLPEWEINSHTEM